MNKTETEKAIIEAVLDEPILLATVVEKHKWWKFKKPTKHDLYIKGATASTMYKITELLLSLKLKSNEKDDEGQLYDLMHSNVNHIVKFLSIAIHNSKGNPPANLVNLLENNFSLEQLQAMASIAYRRLGIEPFFGIMALLREPELKMSITPEKKALGQSSEGL